jgi:chromosome segregation ATPase
MGSYIYDTCAFDRSVYESTVPEDGTSGILRVIKGPVAEWDKLNRNKRRYSEKLWDNVLDSPYVKEQLKYHTLFGEANHPEDRYEVDFGRVSHSITELWKVPASDQIFATINILDTPLGRILNTLYEAGGIIGYSSRAGGTLHQKKDYVEVDENSYNFITFDAVPFPSVESARPNGIDESVSSEKEVCELSEETHREICNIIKESGIESRNVIKDFIYSLEAYDMTKEKAEISALESRRSTVDESISEEGKVEEMKSNSNTEIEMSEGNKNIPDDETTLSLLKESSLHIDRLKVENQALKATRDSLMKENENLKDSLSSSLARVSELVSESSRFDGRLEESKQMLNDTITKLKEEIRELKESVDERDEEIESLQGLKDTCRILEYQNQNFRMRESTVVDESKSIELSNQVDSLNKELKDAYSEISVMIKESAEYSKTLQERDEKIKSLDEKIESLSEDTELKDKVHSLETRNRQLENQIQSLNESLEDSSSFVDRYKEDLLNVICNSYGLSVESVKGSLRVGFTKDDVYRVCESMISTNTRSIQTIIGESTSQTKRPDKVSNEVNKSKARDLFGVNRRGI